MKPTDKNDRLTGNTRSILEKYMSGPGLRKLAQDALAEDIGPGDITSCIFPPRAKGKAILLAKADGILSGTAIVSAVFKNLSRSVVIKWKKLDGQAFKKGDTLAEITGPMRVLLEGERVALNFIQRMSGIATITRQFVQALGKGRNLPGIYDTRKTTPLLRAVEKQAVVHGGGCSHRFALYDMAMLKNNHIDAAGSITEAVELLAENGFYKRKNRLGLCIEARTLDEAVEAALCRADIIMLDNMTPAQITTAAAAVKKAVKEGGLPLPDLEISGGITLKNIKRYAGLPVQRISVGALTHSAPSLDISMRYAETGSVKRG